jgi:hypothetical protein
MLSYVRLGRSHRCHPGGDPPMTPATATNRGRSNRRKGHDSERGLARWLRGNGFSGAERAVRAGYRATDGHIGADPGDITGTPGLVWSVKDCATERIPAWFDELEHMRHTAAADIGLLVVKRRGYADPGRWWCWMWLGDVAALLVDPRGSVPRDVAWTLAPARMELADVICLLRRAGHGDEP